ncbi:MAG: restriction endonuclease [Deltaproteobacteria bacterium]|nr:MAG: restriction endonuclease [Deltaproteobacteria bacterium]
MPIPDYQSTMLPLLTFAGDGKEHSLREAIDCLAERFGLSPEERSSLLPSGQQPIFSNRVAWASTYLKKAGLLEHVKRGVFRISSTGSDILKSNPPSINIAFLEKFPSFVEFREASRKPKGEQVAIPVAPPDEQETPEETLERAYIGIREALAQDLLTRVSKLSPEFFERLVVELLVKMGYGGSRQDAGERIGQSGDGGIDGIIKEDRLGLDVIYIQAKRWQGSVGRPEIQKFVGALQGQRARKGVFITTSIFTPDAKDYASRIDSKVVLIDGPTLATYMIDFDLGVSAIASYSIKRIDSDYFEEE